jgi:hypothetical protein
MSSHKKSKDVGLNHQLKIAKDTLKMSDAGALVAGGMSKRDAVKLIVKHHGIDKAKQLLSKSGHSETETVKLLENVLHFGICLESEKLQSYLGHWFGHETVDKHPAFRQGIKAAASASIANTTDTIKKSAAAKHAHHARTAMQHKNAMNKLLANKKGMTSEYVHHDSELTKHMELSNKYHAFAKGVHQGSLKKN